MRSNAIREPARQLILVAVMFVASMTMPSRASAQPSTTDTTSVTTSVLAPTDWRRDWVGRWEVEFAYDSVLANARRGMRWRAATGRRVTGTLTITDSTVGRGALQQVATLTMNFARLLGHGIACRDSAYAPIRLSQHSAGVTIEFTPNVADCGFSGAVVRKGAAAKGEWAETSIIGPVKRGRLWLRKR